MQTTNEKWLGLHEMLEVGQLNANMPAFKRKKEQAIQKCVEEMRQTDGNIMISISGGKDSVAMVPIVYEAAKTVDKQPFLWAHTSNASFPGTVETIWQVAEKYGLHCIVDESPIDAFSIVGEGSKQRFGKKGYFADAISRAYEENDVTLGFVGVRGMESRRRSKAVDVKGMAFNSSVYGKRVRIVWPLAYMSVIDVFSLISEHNLPIHPIYHKFAVGEKPIRLSYTTSTDLLSKDVAVFLKLNYPDIYNKLANAYPEVRLYG